jgi:hypothetical protein
VDPADGYDETSSSLTVPTCNSGQWCIEPAPVTGTPVLHGVWAASAADVFAVGDAGTIVRRTNSQWSVMTSGTTQNLKGVWGTSSNDVWAVGQNGAVVHFDGTAWSSVTVTTSNVEAVWCSSATDIWMAGPSTVWHSTGGAFTAIGIAGTLYAISGTGPNDVWVTGENTNLHHYTGAGKWTTVNPGASTSTFFSILAVATNNVWAADYYPNKETMRWNGSTWGANKTTSSIFQGMYSTSASDIWGVGGDKIGHWTGSAWASSTVLGTTVSLWSVTGASGNLWTVGNGALIAHYVY